MARTRLLATTAALCVVGLGACAPANQQAADTVTEGKLTIATGEPAYTPWVENDDPASGEGYEAAVAYAVAEELGYAPEDVEWVRTPFDTVIAPGPKDFDLNIQQFSITEERARVVDFSAPYYTSPTALVSIEGNPGADATSLAEVSDVLIGTAVGTTTQGVVEDVIVPSNEIQVFNSNEDAVQALIAGNIDVLAVDLPTAFYLAAAELDGGVVVGQLAPDGEGEDFGFLLSRGSPLTAEVSTAVESLRADGTLDELQERWLTDAAGAPVLQ